MPIPELENFRKKYPDYGDMDDATLAGKLATKYPDAYGDLPGKIKASPAPTTEQSSRWKEIGADILHGAATTASGFNKGITDVAGMPVDIVNQAMKAVRIPVSDTPIGGSKSIKKVMPTEIKPEGMVENILNATGEQAGALLPMMAVPGSSIMGLAKTAAGAGTASGITRTIAPDSPYLDMAAQIFGGTAPSLAKSSIQLISPNVERSMMERAMKPSTTLKEAERMKRVDTALNEGIRTTKAGVEKSKGIISDINAEIQQRIDQFSQQGATVSREKVVEPAYAMGAKELPKQAFPKEPAKQMSKVLGEFSEHPGQIPLRQAQDFKQSINKELDDFYKSLQYSPDKTAALAKAWTNKTKAKIADGLRAEITDVFPEIKDLNQRESSMIQLNKSLERAVNRISQHDIWSLKGVLSMVVHPKYAVVNYVLNNPTVQSSLAVAMRNARSKAINMPGMAGEAIKQAGTVMRGKDESK